MYVSKYLSVHFC